MRNAAYSPNIKERLDHSCALFDRFGRLIAQAEHIPVHLGSLPWGLRRMLEVVERSYGGMREGEMWVANDPYVAGTHLNDVTLVRPVFEDETLVGYAANKAHHADVGGSVPGSMPTDATELYAEGLIVPPMRLVRDDARNRRDRATLPRQLPYSGRAQRRPARAGRRKLHGRAPSARALPPLRLRNARERHRARHSTIASAACARALRTLGDGVFEATRLSRGSRRQAAHPDRACARAARRRCAPRLRRHLASRSLFRSTPCSA